MNDTAAGQKNIKYKLHISAYYYYVMGVKLSGVEYIKR
jgi:hypothetical protein